MPVGSNKQFIIKLSFNGLNGISSPLTDIPI